MLSRFISKSSCQRLLPLISSQCHFSITQAHSLSYFRIPNPTFNFFSNYPIRYFATGNNGGNGKDQSAFYLWKLSSEKDDSTVDSVFGEESGIPEGFHDGDAVETKTETKSDSWSGLSTDVGDDSEDVFKDSDMGGLNVASRTGEGVGADEWETEDGFKPWNFVTEGKEEGDLFDNVEQGSSEISCLGGEEEVLGGVKRSEEAKQLEREEQVLTGILKGPNRAFGDLITSCGITEEMLDSLIALKDLEGIKGLPPLSVIEDQRYEKSKRKFTRAEIERQKQEEVAKARVRVVDAKGRAYGTGKRKCSIARVWIQPGDGNFVINDKQFDVYFPMIDHRATILRPFSETKTLGLWDVNCTVKGGGLSGQVGAVRLGISRALQNWEPDLRPALRSAGFLTRDSRVVERKKPGRAKARKSFQWVKR